MVAQSIYQVYVKDLDIKLMPNDEEFYFCIDLVGNKKVHKSKYIKSKPPHLKFVLLERDQLSIQQLQSITF